MYAFAKPADIEFPQEKVLRLTEQQGEIVCREYRKYVRKASSFYDSKMSDSIDYHNN